MIAALFVDAKGCYAELNDVELWPIDRDARNYSGPYPVVAHPPCERWCRLAGLVEARWGHKRGDDDGCFQSALESVRKFGGVLEHPAYTDAWEAYGLTPPMRGMPWQKTIDGGWVVHVEQGMYGHIAKKATWLYAYGVDDLPQIDNGFCNDNELGLVSWCANRVKSNINGHKRKRVSKRAASATPPAFRDLLIAIARAAA